MRIGSPNRIAAFAVGSAPALLILIGTVGLLASGCGGRMPAALADGSGRLAPCPASPNCVFSDATDARHAIPAYRIRGSAEASWRGLRSHLASLPRVELVSEGDDHLHAVFTTRLMRYRDDVEFELDAAAGEIRIRSASRVGYGDMGTNRARLESIRAALAEQGLVEPLVVAE